MKRLLFNIFLLFFTLTAVNVSALPIDDNDPPPDLPNDQNGPGNEDEPPDEELFDPRCAHHATGTISATPEKVKLDQSAPKNITVSWSAQLPAEFCEGAYLTLNGQPVLADGSITINPMYSGNYRLVVNNAKELAKTFIEIELPETVFIKGNTTDWKLLLIQALGTPNTPPNRRTVILSHDVDMDMTGHDNITVAGNVTLTSAPPQSKTAPTGPLQDFEQLSSLKRSGASGVFSSLISTAPIGTINQLPDITYWQSARDARHPGPRLFTRTQTKAIKPFFVNSCGSEGEGDNVHISGFRLIGPDVDKPVGSDYLHRAIQINGCKAIEITNMEMAGWSGQAIYVQDIKDVPVPGRLFEPSHVFIHDNFFHHNQQKTGGDGYGVEVKHGAYALIERNVFDYNRHAIAAGGEDGTGYTARYNLVLKGGGYHKWEAPSDILPGPDLIDWSFISHVHHTHQFDVHGLEDGWYEACCGQAGEKFEMSHNAFQYTSGPAINVRGTPTIGATISQNVFAHGGASDAIGKSGPGDNIPEHSGSQFGIQTAGKYGVCDFDGDKKDDFFLATGASWWMMSGAKQHWVFLKDSTERLEQLGLGDFDGDHRCDVFSVHANDFGIYKSGTGDWQSLGTYSVPMNQLRFADFNGDGVQDIFRRTPDGQWWIVSPGYYGWEHLGGSSQPLEALRFGDFNGDRIADIIVENDKWKISWSGRFPWEPLNEHISTSLKKLLIADLDGNGKDDIAHYSTDGYFKGKWDVSWNGASKWMPLASLTWPFSSLQVNGLRIIPPSSTVQGYVGRFSGSAASDLLSVDITRRSKILWKSPTFNDFVAYGYYAY
jgi:FG-GAP-like repeat